MLCSQSITFLIYKSVHLLKRNKTFFHSIDVSFLFKRLASCHSNLTGLLLVLLFCLLLSEILEISWDCPSDISKQQYHVVQLGLGSAGTGFGSGTTGKLSHAWVVHGIGAWCWLGVRGVVYLVLDLG